jgi:hypothetical protein
MSFSAGLDVLLRPSEIRLVRRSALLGRLGKKVTSRAVVPEAGAEPWRACVEALGGMLETSGATTSMDVVVSDHFLRYALVPWSKDLVRDAERLALAKLTFSQIYGSMADDWVITIGEQKVGRASLACAIDRGLLQAVQAVARQRGVRMRSLRTALVERLNRHRRLLREDEFCFASIETQRLTLAFHGKAGWLAVRSRRVAAVIAEQLADVLKQEAAAAGTREGGTLYLVSESPTESLPAQLAGWRVVRLRERVGVRKPLAATPPARALAD